MGEVRDPTGIGVAAMAASWAFLAAEAAQAGAALNTLRVLGGFGGPVAAMPELRAADALTGIAAILYLVALLVAAVLILGWIYATNRNAQHWSADVAITPGWNVGWFFVPVASLFMPFQGVRETYQASVDPDEPAGVPVPIAMRLWWGAWIVGGIHGLLVAFSGQPRGVDAAIALSWLRAAALPIIAVQVIALVAVIRRTTRVQRQRIAGA